MPNKTGQVTDKILSQGPSAEKVGFKIPTGKKSGSPKVSLPKGVSRRSGGKKG